MLLQRSLKRHLLLLPLVLSVLFALSGCHGPQYKEAEKEELASGFCDYRLSSDDLAAAARELSALIVRLG